MARQSETVKARSLGDAMEQITSLYPTATDIQLVWRRNDKGEDSSRGHTFRFKVKFPEPPEEPAPDELGEDELEY